MFVKYFLILLQNLTDEKNIVTAIVVAVIILDISQGCGQKHLINWTNTNTMSHNFSNISLQILDEALKNIKYKYHLSNTNKAFILILLAYMHIMHLFWYQL